MPDTKPIPLVHDVDSYIALRVNDQIDEYYKKKATLYDKRVRRLRRVGDMLGVTALVLAAVAAAFKVDSLNAWVPVVTTIGTSVAAYIAAARYDHMVIEFLRTAQRLESLCRERRDKPDEDPAAFIDACEGAISVWESRMDGALGRARARHVNKVRGWSRRRITRRRATSESWVSCSLVWLVCPSNR